VSTDEQEPPYLKEALEAYRSGAYEPPDPDSPFYEYTTVADDDLAEQNRSRHANGLEPLTELPERKIQRVVLNENLRKIEEARKATEAAERTAAENRALLEGNLNLRREEKLTDEEVGQLLELGSVVNVDAIEAQIEGLAQLDDEALQAKATELRAEALRIGLEERVPDAAWAPDADALAEHGRKLDTATAEVAVVDAEIARRAAVQLETEHVTKTQGAEIQQPAWSSSTAPIPAHGWGSPANDKAELMALTDKAIAGDRGAQIELQKRYPTLPVPTPMSEEEYQAEYDRAPSEGRPWGAALSGD